MNRAYNNAEYIDNSEFETPKTFSTIVNNDDILQMYLKEIGRKKMLTRAEELELGRKRNCKKRTCSSELEISCKHCKKIHRSSRIVYGFGTRRFFGFN